MKPLETKSLRLIAQALVTVQAPVEDMNRILASVTAITPLVLGKYDKNAFEAAPGIEHYRPLEGAAAGAESDARKRPGVACISFQIDDDPTLIAEVAGAIFQAHSYQEPVITVQTIYASRSKGLDDSANPHRWWNTTGDWKKTA